MIAPVLSDDSALRFPSLASLRAAHGELLRRQRESTEQPAFLAEVETFLRRGRATGALLDEAEERWEAQSILDYWVTFLFRADRRSLDATLDDFDPELAPKLPDEACPYVGLDPFRESNLFFGRQRMIQAMLQRLATERFLAVVGSSGSGKSSVVLAGVLPALEAGGLPGSASWHYLPAMVPGPEPLVHLARALSPPGTAAETVALQAKRLRENPSYVLEMLDGGRPHVLVVDQFEEAFTLCTEEPVRQAFADTLVALIQAPGLRHTVLLTMRSDYEDNVAKLGSFQSLFESAQVRVMPLSETELRDAILKPAELVGLKFENGLVEALLHDILGEQAGLPLLQFTLLKLWEKRKHDRVTWEAYHSLRGARLALATSADEFYKALIPQNQDAARSILLRMVRPNEGLEVTSSRVRRADLHRVGIDPGRIDRVLEQLVDVHLVRLTPGETRDDDQFEVAHEALVRNWPTLVEWLKEERSGIAMRSRLEAMVKEWLLLEKKGGLLDEVQLRDAEHWLASASALQLGYHPELPALVQASREAIEDVKRKEKEAYQRELEVERRRAKDKTRLSRIFRALAVAMTVLFIISLFASWRALREQRNAEVALAGEKAARNDAVEQEDLAKTAAAEAIIKAREAETARQQALESQKNAETARQQAVDEKRRADEARQQALKEKKLADEARRNAEAAQLMAEVEREVADQLRKAAEESETKAKQALIDKDEALERAVKAVAEANRQGEAAKEALAQYEEQKRVADKAQALTVEAYQNPEVARASNRGLVRPKELKLDQRTRPLRFGASIGSPLAGTGSLCCVVKDSAGVRYLLGLQAVFGGQPGTPILQPGHMDGGELAEDKVATLVRVGQGGLKAAALARLDPGVAVDFRISKIGEIKGVETTVYPGDKVRLVGRSSGIVEGRVIQVNDREVITTIIPLPGDAGAPVLSDDGDLVGLLLETKQQGSFVVRIGPILQELDVRLVEN